MTEVKEKRPLLNIKRVKNRTGVSFMLTLFFYASVVLLLITLKEYLGGDTSAPEDVIASAIGFAIFGLMYGAIVKERPILIRVISNKFVAFTVVVYLFASMVIGSFDENFPLNLILLSIPILGLILIAFRYYQKSRKTSKE